jgi:hypothetical protein
VFSTSVIVDLRDPSNSHWALAYRYFDGIHATAIERPGGANARVRAIGFDTPFGSWQPHAVSVLPSEHVVFELRGYIVLWDLNTGAYGVLAEGYCPVVGSDVSLPWTPSPWLIDPSDD